jgi:hypothetical protein
VIKGLCLMRMTHEHSLDSAFSASRPDLCLHQIETRLARQRTCVCDTVPRMMMMMMMDDDGTFVILL